MTEKNLIIFVKNPVEGKVKTRLAATIGNKNALIIYQALLNHTKDLVLKIDAKRYLFYDQKIEVNDSWKSELFIKKEQSDGDLGLRMMNAFSEVIDNEITKTIIIGSDCIELNSEIVEYAFQCLDSNDVVIGPAEDGGYYLLGMKSLHKNLFIDKSWSTEFLLKETIHTVEKEKLSFKLLPTLSDVDSENNLNDGLRTLIKA